MGISMERVVRVTGGIPGEGTDLYREYDYFTVDSRETAGHRALFFAFRGDRTDAHSYLPQVLSDPQCGAVIDEKEYLSANTVLVPSSRAALLALASDYRNNELRDTVCIGITGSVGKTTVKEMTMRCVGSGMPVCGTRGNMNSQVGLPRTVLETMPGIPAAVYEMGMSLPGELERLTMCARPDIVIITGIGASHIEAFGTRERIRDEKLTILRGLRDGGRVIVNGDDPLLSSVDGAVRCGIDNPDNEVYAYNLRPDGKGTACTVNLLGEEFETYIGAVGRHSVVNALLAFAAAHIIGVSTEKMKDSLGCFTAGGNRMRIVDCDGITVIADCYNSSPEALHASLGLLAEQSGRRIAVLGDMFELGGHSARLHAEAGRRARECGVDALFCMGEGMLAAAASAGVPFTMCFPEGCFDRAAEELKKYVRRGDAVLIKGSHGMHLEILMKKVFGI